MDEVEGGISLIASLAAAVRRACSTDNPVLLKEFRTRMRGSRAYALLLSYLVPLTLVLGIVYLQWLSARSPGVGGAGSSQGWTVGSQIFHWVFAIQAVLVALITPALTAGAITIEREQRSYEMLVITRLRPVEVVTGKLVAALAFVGLLLTSSLPLLSLSFFFGGVSPGELFFTYLSLSLAAFVYGAIGIVWSCVVPGTAAATVLTYASVFSLALATASPAAVPDGSGFVFRSLNPVAAVFNAVDGEAFYRWQLPSWISAAVLNGLAGVLLTALAARRLEQFVSRSAAAVRVTATLLWTASLLFVGGYLVGNARVNWAAATTPREIAISLLGTALVGLCLVVPIFATGDVVLRRGENAAAGFLRGLRPRHALNDDLPAGVPLMGLWVCLALLLVPVSFFLVGRSWLTPGTLRTVLPAATVMVSVVFGIVGLGSLFSVLLPSRWAALTMTYLALVALMLLPLLGLVSWHSSLVGRSTPALQWQFLYLVPYLAYVELLDPTRFALNLPPMYLDGVPFWAVTAGLYALIGAASTGACLLALNSHSRRLESTGVPAELTLDQQRALA